MPATTPTPDSRVFDQWQSLARTELLPPQWLADTLQYVPELVARLVAQQSRTLKHDDTWLVAKGLLERPPSGLTSIKQEDYSLCNLNGVLTYKLSS